MGQMASRAASPGDERSRETDRLLPVDQEEWARDGCYPPHGIHDECPSNPYPHLPIYTTIHLIRKEIIDAIDDPYSPEQLRDPRMNVSVVRPLVDKLYNMKDVSSPVSIESLANISSLISYPSRFLREQMAQPHQQSVRTTRALLCELIANRVLRRVHEETQGSQGLLHLSQILVGGFDPFQGAPDDVIAQEEPLHIWGVRTGSKRRLAVLEIAIISESKTFLSSAACQRVVNAIYEGRVVYTPTSFIDILPDHYKQRPISLYNPRKAPIFNQYRLIVPRTRSILEVCSFMILLALFVSVMAGRDASTFSVSEGIFVVYALGWVLDLFASVLEHGWRVYTQNLWSFLDVTFSVIFTIYLVLRIHGWKTRDIGYGQQALDVLAMGASVLVPRLAFNLMSENMLFISLREMMKDFTVLTLLAVWCFGGFLLSMLWLTDGAHSPITISKWMLWVWFGLDGTGIQRSVEFHRILGPILMVAFAFLGNTLFLTILVSMLSTTFSTIVANATAEIQFRRAVVTLEGVKSDALFAYLPPFNILALLIMLPMKLVLTPRWFHKVNVAVVRTLNAPLLLIIGLVERKILSPIPRSQQQVEQQSMSRAPARPSLWNFRQFSVQGGIQAVFDGELPDESEDEMDDDEEPSSPQLLRKHVRNEIAADSRKDDEPNIRALTRTQSRKSERRDSIDPFGQREYLKNILNEAQNEDDEGANLKDRLRVLEESNMRIEKMLARLVGDLDPPLDRSGSTSIGETGTLLDLDKSGTTDLDD